MKVWLASNSPRRYAMLHPLFPNLHQSGVEGVDETPPKAPVEQQVLDICRRKATAVTRFDHDLIVVADTMLSDPDDHSLSLGKPRDRSHAAMMLHRLSGRMHQVWTATGLHWNGEWRFWVECAVVAFPEFTEAQLEALLDSGSWQGKAGGYDLAGPMGEHARLVEGDEATVLGVAGSAMALLKTLAEMN
ncbi:MAG: Maf family protein [Poseidonia sp.]